MSDRYANHINNNQAADFRRATEASNDALGRKPFLGQSNQISLRSSFDRNSNFEAFRVVKENFNVDASAAGKDENPDFINGVNLNYNPSPDQLLNPQQTPPSFNLQDRIENGEDKPLHGTPNKIVPLKAIDDPSLEREPSNVASHPEFNIDNRDGGGFGNFDATRNNPATHREAVGSYLQNYTRGQAANFGNSTN